MILAKNIFLFLIAITLITLSFTLANWLFNFSTIFYVDRIFSVANPLGTFAIIIILIVGGFYLFKIGFTALKNTV